MLVTSLYSPWLRRVFFGNHTIRFLFCTDLLMFFPHWITAMRWEPFLISLIRPPVHPIPVPTLLSSLGQGADSFTEKSLKSHCFLFAYNHWSLFRNRAGPFEMSNRAWVYILKCSEHMATYILTVSSSFQWNGCSMFINRLYKMSCEWHLCLVPAKQPGHPSHISHSEQNASQIQRDIMKTHVDKHVCVFSVIWHQIIFSCHWNVLCIFVCDSPADVKVTPMLLSQMTLLPIIQLPWWVFGCHHPRDGSSDPSLNEFGRL